MGKALTTIKDELNNSPMYNLSLSSKELFHSNLFAWLGNTMETKRFFIEMIKELTKTKNDSGIELGSIKNWSVEREEKNFDLCIKSGDDYLLIIENKVKSIPRKDQLDEYEEKIKKHYKKADKYPTRFLLLTLANEFPHKKDIKDEKKWKIKTYADLSDAMNNNIGLLLEQYHKSLIQDYSNFIRNMDLLVKIWQNNENFACTTDLDGLNKLSDLHEKIQFSYYSIRLKDLLIRSIKDVVVFDNKDKKDKRFAKKVDEKENKLYIMVDWDIANYSKRGLVDIEIPITDLNMPKIQLDCCNPKYVIKIQVEGRSYRHVLQILDKYTLRTTTNLADIGKKDKYTTVLKWFTKEPSEEPSSTDYGCNDIFKNGLSPEKEGSLRNKQAWPFKSYTLNSTIGFIYQNRVIKDSAKVDDVLHNLVSEVKRLIEELE